VLGQDCKIEVEYPRYPSPGVKDEVRLDAESLRAVVDLDNVDFTISGYEKGRDYGGVYLLFARAVEGKSFAVYASDKRAFRCLEIIATSLDLEQTEEPVDDREDLETRVAALGESSENRGEQSKVLHIFQV